MPLSIRFFSLFREESGEDDDLQDRGWESRANVIGVVLGILKKAVKCIAAIYEITLLSKGFAVWPLFFELHKKIVSGCNLGIPVNSWPESCG